MEYNTNKIIKMKDNETKPVLYPLFSKLVYVKKTNINTDKILSLVKKENLQLLTFQEIEEVFGDLLYE